MFHNLSAVRIIKIEGVVPAYLRSCSYELMIDGWHVGYFLIKGKAEQAAIKLIYGE